MQRIEMARAKHVSKSISKTELNLEIIKGPHYKLEYHRLAHFREGTLKINEKYKF